MPVPRKYHISTHTYLNKPGTNGQQLAFVGLVAGGTITTPGEHADMCNDQLPRPVLILLLAL